MSETTPTRQLSRDELSRLIRKLGRGKARSRDAGIEPLDRRADDRHAEVGRFPLSFAQERLWLLHQLHPDSATYHVAGGVALSGPLRPAALAAALAEVVRRHEALRTTFEVAAGEPVQVVAPPAPPPLPVVDLSALPPPQRRREAGHRQRREARRPFDLVCGPLARAVLLRLDGGRHRLLLTLHHVVADGWSLRLLLRELPAAYGAALEGRSSPLPPPAVQYADFASWQRRRLTGERLEELIAPWRERLAGVPPLELPSDRPRGAARRFRGDRVAVTVAADAVTSARELARAEGTTLFTVVEAAFALLLARHAGARRLTVGTPVAGRQRPEVEATLGCFVNTLVLHHQLPAGAASFRRFLAASHRAVADAQESAELPFEKLVAELRPERQLSSTPLFQVMLVFESEALDPREVAGLRWEPFESETGTAKFDLALHLTDRSGRLHGHLEYDRDRFDRTTVERFGGHFERLLRGAVASPESPIRELPWTSAAERHQLFVEWWTGGPAVTPPETLPARLGSVAARYPESAAVIFDGGGAGTPTEVLSFGALLRGARRLARALRRRGVGRGARVGLCCERGPALAVGILGIWRAGAAYLPLDPRLPETRLRFMAEDAGACVAVTAGDAGTLVARWGLEAVDVRSAVAGSEDAGPPGAGTATPEPGDDAYLIYTSGTTGWPKGVVVGHRQLAHTLDAGPRRLGLGAGERELMPCVAPFTFDVFLFELFAPMLTAGTSLMLPLHPVFDPDRLVALVGTSTSFHAVPAVAGRVAARCRELGVRLRGLRRIFVGGDAVPPELLAELAALAPGAELRVLYGPTEATVICSSHRVEPRAPRPFLGRPFAGVGLRVVDRWGETVPIGVAGELRIEGPGLSRGYLGLPAATAGSFVPAAAEGAGARSYRSGDQARYLPTGELEFLGRADRQVKVRGLRIELGEVEAALRAEPAVAAAAVAVREVAGERRLVAWLVPAPGVDPDPGALRSSLARRLPGYMVPSEWQRLEALPLTPHGKVDRKALSERPLSLDESGGREEEAPRTAAEKTVAEIFAELLGRERVGVDDDFFALGGHSLLATRVTSRIREAFGVELPLVRLFAAPTVAGLAAAIGELEAEAAAAERPPAGLVPPLRPRRGADDPPLSYAQERLWFLDRLEPGRATYHVPARVEMAGRLSVSALRAALRAVVRRHEALRTTFAERRDGPVQVVATPSSAPVPLPVVDLAGLAPTWRGREASRLTAAVARRPFDLASGPLWRVLLLRRGPDDHRLVINLHHAIADGWSLGVLVRELGALYRAALERAPSALPRLPVQYPDYAAWQRGWLRREELDRRLGYWRKRLAGAPVLELPTDRPRPAVTRERGGSLAVSLPRDLSKRLGEVGRSRGATLFMTLLAGFGALLSRYSGQRDLTVGTPVAGRTRVEVEGLIGFFVNTLVLRLDLGSGSSGGPSFAEVLARTREEALAADGHQEVPFEKVVAALQPDRDRSTPPLFQAMLVLQNAPFGTLELPGLEVAPSAVETGTAKFDLLLSLEETGSGLAGAVEYDRDLFDRTTVERLVAHFARLLAGATAAPGVPVGELELLSAAERHQAVLEWNDTAAALGNGAGTTLTELLADRAERCPEAVAVVDERSGLALSYRELHRRGRALAARLAALGAGRERPVAVALERSPELMTSLLGALYAGAPYLPVDPEYPRERIAFLLEDSRAPVVVTAGEPRERLPETLTPTLSPLAGRGCPLPTGAGGEGISHPEDLAYVIYTSGSTGKPKGAMNRHRSIVNRLLWMQHRYRLGAGDRVFQKTPTSFDVSVWELFWPLLTGSALVLARPGGHRDPGYLRRAIARQRVTTLHFVPSMLGAFLAEPGIEGCRSVQRVIASGEALPPAQVERFGELLAPSGAVLENLYGPTEAAVDVTRWPCPRTGAVARVPIGRPVWNTRIHLVDRSFRPVPIGVSGELLIGGVQLARGYHRRPGLTAERFVPDPLSAPFGAPGGRVYRTGDLARQLPDGTVEFQGRLDHQVKLRGQRIELGEIESALRRQPGVGEAAVLLREGPAGPLLAAYLASSGELPTAEELRARLGAELPEAMVPSVFEVLEALPLLPNGKLDRRALLERPLPSTAVARSEYRAPRTPVEETLCSIFAELLGIERVGIDDGFFALGGHSLLATRVTSRIRDVFGVELPLRLLFDAPTAAGVAAAVTELGAPEPETGVVPPLRPRRRDGDPPLSHAQERLWFLDRLEPGRATYNVPARVEMAGRLSVPALRAAFAGVVARHEALRTTFAEGDSNVDGDRGPVQVIAPPAAMPATLPVVDLAKLAPAARAREASRLTADAARRPFDLASGPLLRTVLLRLAESEHTLVVNLHHAVADGWSLGVLVRELGGLYRAALEGAPSPLPPLVVQYPDYAAWQRGWLTGEELERRLGYWRQRLADPPVLELPTDRPRPAAARERGGSLAVSLPRDLSKRLGEVGRSRGATLFMTLLAGFGALLSRHAGQEDLTVGTPVAGRDRVALEGLIGFFVNTLVLRLDLGSGSPDGPTFAELLARAREETLAADAHREVPFEKVVAELQPERDRSTPPLFQAMLVLQNAPLGALELPGLEVVAAPVETGTAKFDLHLSLAETPAGLTGAVEYDRDLFDRTTIERLMDRFGRLLASAVASPGTPVRALPLLSPAERHQLLVEWQGPTLELPPETTLAELFAERAARVPERAAVVRDGEVVSYGALDRRAGRLARRLRQAGVGPGTIVGVCLDRTPELVVAVLAVHQAGGAYAPMDPEYPEERLRFLLEDSGAEVVVTRAGLGARVPGFEGVVVELPPPPEGETVGLVGPVRPARLSGSAGPNHLSHLIYTSGSTGRPKGVAIEHRSAVALVTWARETFEPAELDRVLASTSINFDLSIFELFVTLASGGTVVLAADALELPGLGARERATLVNTVPSAMAELVRQGALPRSLRAVNLAGEPLRRELVDGIHRLLPAARVRNLYGPSEDTTYSTWTAVPAGDAAVTIGRPLAGTRGYVLDRRFRPVPIGVVGELLLGGAGVARGYLGRGALTAERFVPDPWGGAGSRLYRTGDLVRHRADGELIFLGRADHQVKVRGFRIELGEIESALGEVVGVSEAAVVARTVGDEVRLAAYLTAGGEAPEVEAVRAELGSRLPAPLLPSYFELLDDLPRLPNGKVDRKTLAARPLAGAAGDPGSAEYRAPCDAAEEILCTIFADVLGVERVGVDDGFFALGGHSLLATRVASRVRDAFGVELPLRRLFDAPTVAGVAAAVGELRSEGGGALPPLRPRTEDGPPPLSHAQERLWFLDRLEPGRAAYNVPARVAMRGRLAVAALRAALAGVVARHGALRTTFAGDGGDRGPVQAIAPAAEAASWRRGWAAVPVVDLAALPPAARRREAARRASAAARRPFDLASGPLLRTLLLHLAEDEHALVVNLHHAVADGWSLEVLVRELGTFYRAALEGAPSPLPPLPVQYADYAVWQRRWLRGEELERRLGYWRRQLSGTPALELPADRPRSAAAGERAGSVELALPPPLAGALRSLARERSATLFMTLLAGFAALLARHSGQEELTVGTPVAGRDRVEVEGLIGFFVNTLVLRLRPGGGGSFSALVAHAREVTLEAHGHREVPFERVVSAVAPERDTATTPLFQAMLVLQDAGATRLELPGLEVASEGLDPGTTKFDLTLYLAEVGEGIAGRLAYRADLFDRTRMMRMAGQLRSLFESAVASPERPVASLELLSAAERHLLLREWGEGGAVPATLPERTVPEAILARAEERPEAVAVVFESEDGTGERLSYGALATRARRLASALRGAGVAPEDRVAILAARSPSTAVAILGVHLAGAAYLPLDPSFPAERLRFMVEDAGAEVLVAGDGLGERLPGFGGVVLGALTPDPSPGRGRHSPPSTSAQGEGRSHPPKEPLPLAFLPPLPGRARRVGRERGAGGERALGGSAPDPAHLAYLIYTSGSTGRPKGVGIEHRQLASYLRSALALLDAGPGASFATVTTPAADLGNTAIFGALATGGTLHLLAEEVLSDPAAMASYGERERVDAVKFVPSHLSALLAGDRPSEMLPRRRLMVAGEAVDWPLVRRVGELAPGPGFALLNSYGPTETTVAVAMGRAPRVTGPAPGSRTLPLGRPLPGCRIHLVDRRLRAVPAGVAGEVAVGGAQVTRGYPGRGAATAESFVPDPFGDVPGARLYRTGDRARHLASGEVEFLGRIDHQVKIRGYRIEPGEVAAALEQHPSVTEAVVLPLPSDAAGELRLVAFVVADVVADAADTADAADLEAHLRGRLPGYMVPAGFVRVDAVPLTANGKVDRRELARRAETALRGGAGASAWTAPRTPSEAVVAGLFADLLGVGRVGAEASFFELGGHSLLATRLITRLRRAFGVELPLRAVFEAPTVAALARRAEAARGGAAAVEPIVASGPEAGPAPLSFAQERLWFLDRLAPGEATYNLPYFAELRGPLHPPAFASALGAVVRRHRVLRTTFPARGGEPVAVAHPYRGFTLPLVDLGGLPPARRDAEASRLEASAARRPFDLATGPLLRATLLRLGGEEHRLLLCLHHTVSDAWSRGILGSELAAAYGALVAGRRPRLPALPVQYDDYARWQRRVLAGERLEAHLAHWRRRLAGTPVLELPTERPRSAASTRPAGELRGRLPAPLSAAVTELGHRHGATPFMVLLAATSTLLARLAGQDDLAVGSPIAGRTREEVEPLVGFFVNTLVLRLDLSERPTFAELLARARETTLDAHGHQEVPFEKVVEAVDAGRELSTTPLFQVMLVLQNAPEGSFELPGVTVEPRPHGTGTAKYDLTLAFAERGSELGWTIEYDRHLFDHTTVRRLAARFERLLAGAAADPGVRILELPLLGRSERQQLLREWNDTAPAPAPWRPVVERVVGWAAERPEAVAVADGDRHLSYRELERRSRSLAHRLRREGVAAEAEAEAVVAVCAERSAAAVVAYLAVWRVGGVYLPLDPGYPRERLAFMVADSGAPVVLASEVGRGSLGAVAGVRVLAVEGDPSDGSDSSDSSDGSDLRLAYLIYTSGSTGRPKGVMVSHRTLAGLVDWHRSAYRVTPGDRASVVAGPAFDASVWEIWPYLASGAGLLLPAESARVEPAALRRWLGERRITLSFLPTPLAELVVTEPRIPGSALRTLLTGGDRLHRRPAPEQGFTLVNHYGPTEGTVVSTRGVVTAVTPGGELGGAPDVGRPIRGVRAVVMDRWLRPVPLGSAGELCIGGTQLARGYLRRPALTAERFVPDPSGDSLYGDSSHGDSSHGDRLYRSGDLVRQLADGRIDFLGRIDHQVKVRGFRVELGEIESALAGHPSVVAAAVLAVGAEAKRLVAFLVAEPAATPAVLRDRLLQRLPEHMVPAAFVELDELPLTANGKVDRRALEALAADAEGVAGGERIAPRNLAEELVAGIFSELLGVPEVGADDSFFELGGHSLLATRAAARIRDAFGVELPLRRFFDSPTVAGVARAVAEARAEPSEAAPPLRPVPRGGPPLPLSYAQERLWFLDRLDPGGGAYNVPAAVRLTGELAPAALEAALGAVAARHETLRTTFGEVDGQPVQRIAPAARVPLPAVDLGALPAPRRLAEARRWLDAEGRRGFDLAAGPLHRALLLRLDDGDHLLHLTLHHAIADGWSMGVLVREVGALYGAAVAGRSSLGRPSLPPLPVQYADHAVWQRRWLAGDELERHLAHWRRRLAGVPVLELPTDRPRRGAGHRPAARVPVTFPGELHRRLVALGRGAGATLHMVLVAGFSALLGRLAGQDDVAVGTPVAGRTRVEVEGLIGFFVNTLVLRTDLAGGPGFAEVVGRVREVTLDAHGHQEVPFEKVVAEVAPDRELATTPLFQVMVALQNAPIEPAALPGLELEPVATAGGEAKFDLSLTLGEAGGELAGSLEYDRHLFDRTTVLRLAGGLERLLRSAVGSPSTPVARLPLLAPGERHQLLVEWPGALPSAHRPATDAGPTVPELLLAVAARRPESAAVLFDGADGTEVLTFGALAERSGRLAAALRRRGVGRGSRVGLWCERGPAVAVAVLGVWRAGAAYLPLDPHLPAARLRFTIEDAGVRLLVTSGAGAGEVSGELDVLDLDSFDLDVLDSLDDVLDLDAPGGVPDEARGPEPGDPAYLIYTSGTTGRPKGVELRHRNLAHTLGAGLRDFGFAVDPAAGDPAAVDPAERMPCVAPFTFDIFLFELLAPLLAGGTSLIQPLHPVFDLDRLVTRVASSTSFHAVPAVARRVVDRFREVGSRPRGLRRIFVGGDAVPPELLADLLALAPAAEVRVLYGPTEGTLFCSWHRVDPRSPRPLLGRPLGGVELRILDRRGEPVPIGAAGEVVIAGPGVAAGYPGRPGLTAERFVPGGAGAGGRGGRGYRSGDLARRRRSGELEFLGRTDHQVKVRGLRIELGEIESALRGEPAVSAAAVVAREVAGDRRLAAYLVPAATDLDPEALPDALRDALARRLPDYMVPSAFVAVEALPLTAHGKVDRAALARRPASELVAAGGPRTAPRTAVEELVAGIFAELLGLEEVGADDSFFDLGGHSLLATRAVSKVRERLGVEVPLRRLFESPTVAGVAEAVAELRSGLPPAPPIRPREPEYAVEAPLSFAQERLWILDRFEPGNPAYNMPFPVRLRGSLDAAALRWSLGRLVGRHESLRTTFHGRGGKPVQRIAPELELPTPRIDLSGLDPEARRRERERLVAAASLAPFDLEQGPLLRTWLLRLGVEEHLLAFTIHHAVCDGWSLGVLVRELGALYRSAVAGTAPALAPATLQYADYAVAERRRLTGEELERHLGYWRRRLADPPAALELPTDRPRPAVRSFEGGSRRLRLGGELAERLRELGRRRGTTLFMTLLAAFDLLLHRLSGQGDLAVGTPIAGRNRSETEGMVGIFLNTLVLRSEPDQLPEPTFAALLHQLRERTLEAYAHQELPFEKLLDELQPERDLSRTPLFQIFFNMANMPIESLDLGGLVIEPESIPEPPSKFDVTVYVREEAGGIRFSAVYNALLFDGARIEEMLRQYRRILERVAAEPGVVLGELDLRTDEARTILPDPTVPLGAAFRGSVVELFHQRATEHPHRVAVADPHGAWSYAELRRRASRIARRLADAGLEPGEVVAILAHRSAALVAAVYGTLEAGGAFLLMDPAYPGPRLAEIVEAARPRAFLALADPPPELDAAVANERPRLRLAIPPWGVGGEDPTAAGPGLEAPVPVTADGLAYLSFTSGSTGKPKGIEGRHGPLTHFLPWQCRRFDLGEHDRYSMLSGLAHDPLQRDLFTPLTTGGSLAIPDPARIFAAGYLASWLAAERVTVAHLTPAMAQIVTEAPAAGTRAEAPPLRRAFLTGEALTWRDVTRLRRLAPGVTCVNFYGSTETQRAVGTCEAPAVDVLERGGHEGKEILPLGRGMEDVQLLVVNPEGRLAGVGELGEVWVRSPHLARGYLGDPELTADRFRRNPWGDDPADRVYRTGDLGRYLPDGRVAFAGRVDFQVQIRGYRVEPGEVEAALARIEGVREAVVLVQGEGREARLVAYLARDPGPAGETLEVEGVRRELRRKLPAYTVPDGFLLLDRLPLTPNAKVDRRALQRMEAESAAKEGYLAPETALERSLAELLKELLGLERVGVEDNFFDLGANSLLLVRFHGRLQELLGREVAAMELFNHPTIRTLAAHLTRASETTRPPTRPVEDRGDRLKTGRARLRRLKGRRGS